MIMSHIHNLSWKLVSQFISWDFCKYTSEQSDVVHSEKDVLTYLRNMIVERTENIASQVSEHEIIAKFIMEAKTIRSLSRISCLENLADSIKKMYPVFTKELVELLAHLESLLESLESKENSENMEILESRMCMAVNEFSAKACKVLPDPPLLKILETWHQTRKKGKYPKNPDLYRKVLASLQAEVKSSDTTEIASALYDDEIFKRILCSGVDSQDFSVLSSQPWELSCPDSLQLSERIHHPPLIRSQYLNNSLSFEPSQSSNRLPDSQHSIVPRYIPVGNTSPQRLADNIDRLGPLTQAEAFLYENPRPTPLIPDGGSPVKRTSDDPLSPFKRNAPKRAYRTNSFTPPLIIHVQEFEDEDSGDSPPCFPTQKPVKLKTTRKRKKALNRVESSSESQDTSDCDKDPDLRFLTPTMFKKGQKYEPPKVVYLSDQESCNSSIVTTYFDSQQNDPSFKPAHKVILDMPIKNRTPKKNQKKSKAKPKTSKNQKKSIQTTLTSFTTTSNIKAAPFSLNKSRADFKKNTGKKKKLFDPDVAAPSTSAGAPSSLNRKRKPSTEIQSLGNKRRCSLCNITYRTSQELKKHIFIFHTYDDIGD